LKVRLDQLVGELRSIGHRPLARGVTEEKEPGVAAALNRETRVLGVDACLTAIRCRNAQHVDPGLAGIDAVHTGTPNRYRSFWRIDLNVSAIRIELARANRQVTLRQAQGDTRFLQAGYLQARIFRHADVRTAVKLYLKSAVRFGPELVTFHDRQIHHGSFPFLAVSATYLDVTA
jgi:hypothetical protein